MDGKRRGREKKPKLIMVVGASKTGRKSKAGGANVCRTDLYA